MGVTWSAGVDNANWSLNNGLIGGSNLTDSQRQYLASMGMLSNTGQTTVQGLGHDPIKWQGELGRENFLGQLSNWEDMLNQQRMGMLNTQQQLNATGQQISDAGGRLSSDLSRTEQAIRDTNTGVQRDYENADSALRGYGRSAKRSALDRERQGMASSEASLRSRGLGNTTVMDNARNQIQSDTNRELSTIEESVGTARSGLNERRAGARAQTGQYMTDFMGRAGAMNYGSGMYLANFMQQRAGIDYGQNSDLVGLLNQKPIPNWMELEASKGAAGAAAKVGQTSPWGMVGNTILGGVAGGVGQGVGSGFGGWLGGLFGKKGG